MSHTMTIEQAAARLAELVDGLKPGDEIVLTSRNRSVARIVPSSATTRHRQPGSCKGMLALRHEDTEHLQDFEDYMP